MLQPFHKSIQLFEKAILVIKRSPWHFTHFLQSTTPFPSHSASLFAFLFFFFSPKWDEKWLLTLQALLTVTCFTFFFPDSHLYFEDIHLCSVFQLQLDFLCCLYPSFPWLKEIIVSQFQSSKNVGVFLVLFKGKTEKWQSSSRHRDACEKHISCQHY